MTSRRAWTLIAVLSVLLVITGWVAAHANP